MSLPGEDDYEYLLHAAEVAAADRMRRTPRCRVCGEHIVLGQPRRHWTCSPMCEGCRRPLGPRGENCECPRSREVIAAVGNDDPTLLEDAP